MIMHALERFASLFPSFFFSLFLFAFSVDALLNADNFLKLGHHELKQRGDILRALARSDERVATRHIFA